VLQSIRACAEGLARAQNGLWRAQNGSVRAQNGLWRVSRMSCGVHRKAWVRCGIVNHVSTGFYSDNWIG